ncbi:MAG: hypothetical protein HGA39_05700 [Coriobacteriia bacterium]|nr:hypothetical protein [Coriobacteriia bacterium]
MKRTKRRLVAASVSVALVAALAVPAIALAAPQSPASTAITNVAANATQKMQDLKLRVETALTQRAKGFNTAADTVRTNLGKLTDIADNLAGRGGNVGAARAMIAKANRTLDAAIAAEAKAVAQFKLVPTASNKFEAFRQAQTLAREAQDKLQLARTQLRDAASELRNVVSQLKADAPANVSNGQ